MQFRKKTTKEISHMGNARHFKTPYKRLYNRLVAGAKRKNRKVTLTYEEFLEFTKINRCDYCNDPVEWIPHGKTAIKYNLDRRKNNLGYSKNNCVVCCTECNFLKSDMCEGKFLTIIDKIYTNLLS